MIVLNLLPPERRALLRQRQRLLASRRLSVIVLGVVVVISGLHLLGLSMLKSETLAQNRAAARAQTSLATDESKALTADIRSINLRTGLLQDLRVRDRSWGMLVADLAAMMPAGVSLTKLSINQLDRTVILQGSAASRTELLSLKDALLSGKFVEEFETPLSDLTKRDAIPFSVTTHVPVATLDHYLRTP